MNDTQHTDEQIEAMLQGLPLQEPSRMLDERVERALLRRRFGLPKLAMAACFGGVCFALGLLAGQQDAPQASDPPAAHEAATSPPRERSEPAAPTGLRLASNTTRIDEQIPVAQAQLLYDLGDGPPIRATVQDTIERTRWVDKENNRDIELMRPVREVSFTRDIPY